MEVDAGTRAVYSGVAAVVGVNAVLLTYVGSALWEDSHREGGRGREDDGKKED
jgi:hypothetical protein